MVAKRKTTIASILFTSDVAELVNNLSSSGHDQETIIISLDKYGGLRVVSSFYDRYKCLGMLQTAIRAVGNSIMGNGINGTGEIEK